MVNFEIGKYSIYKFMGKNADVWIYLKDVSNKYRGYIVFRKDYSGDKKYIVHPNGIFQTFTSLDKLHPCLDILRMEKPVYLTINEKYKWSALRTGWEQVGEEETLEIE